MVWRRRVARACAQRTRMARRLSDGHVPPFFSMETFLPSSPSHPTTHNSSQHNQPNLNLPRAPDQQYPGLSLLLAGRWYRIAETEEDARHECNNTSTRRCRLQRGSRRSWDPRGRLCRNFGVHELPCLGLPRWSDIVSSRWNACPGRRNRRRDLARTKSTRHSSFSQHLRAARPDWVSMVRVHVHLD